MKDKFILDATCGGRMIWFSKNNPNCLYVDERIRDKGFMKTRPNFEIKPDIQADFTNLPFKDNSFALVIFDPPHTIRKTKEGGIIAERYGRLLLESWESDLARGFSECWRVLKEQGVLIFKWAECDKKINQIKPFFPAEPLFGTRLNRNNKTLWICFMKILGPKKEII